LIIYFILTLPIVFLVLIIGLNNRKLRDIISLKCIQYGMRFMLYIVTGAKVTVKGTENIPKDTSVLYIGNHNGFYDVLVGYAHAQGLTGFIAKKEFLKIPGLNWWMHLGNCLFLDRQDPRAGMKVILKAVDLIKRGVSVFVFPEGTRSRTGNMGEFKEGTFKIATKTNCPIIPVAFTGTASAFEEHFPRVTPTTISVTYGEPIYTGNLSREEKKNLAHITQSRIQAMLDDAHSNF